MVLFYFNKLTLSPDIQVEVVLLVQGSINSALLLPLKNQLNHQLK